MQRAWSYEGGNVGVLLPSFSCAWRRRPGSLLYSILSYFPAAPFLLCFSFIPIRIGPFPHRDSPAWFRSILETGKQSALHITEGGWEGNQTGIILCSLGAFFLQSSIMQFFSIVCISSHLIGFLSRSSFHRANGVLWWLCNRWRKNGFIFKSEWRWLELARTPQKNYWIAQLSSSYPSLQNISGLVPTFKKNVHIF